MKYFYNRWKIIIHGAIDGFSRFVIYLHAASNNRASTVLNCFNVAVQKYGYPSRVRGLENVEVSSYPITYIKIL